MAPTPDTAPDMTPENYVKSAIASLNNSPPPNHSVRGLLTQWSAWSWLIVLGVILAVGLPMIALRTISQPTNYAPQEASKAVAARSQVAALGRIEPQGGVTDVGIPLGSIVAEVLVAEGRTV
ncbi:MAG: hypothetical protein AAFP03_02705, partial [Cyanobacteria bacterium J06598_3]